MARPVWSGAISFGLVNVAVKAGTAAQPAKARVQKKQATKSTKFTSTCVRKRALRKRA